MKELPASARDALAAIDTALRASLPIRGTHVGLELGEATGRDPDALCVGAVVGTPHGVWQWAASGRGPSRPELRRRSGGGELVRALADGVCRNFGQLRGIDLGAEQDAPIKEVLFDLGEPVVELHDGRGNGR